MCKLYNINDEINEFAMSQYGKGFSGLFHMCAYIIESHITQ